MALIHFATDDSRHEIVLPSHRITAVDPCPSSDEHSLVVIDGRQSYHVRESLESVAAKLDAAGVKTYRIGSIGNGPVPVEPPAEDKKDAEQPEAQPAEKAKRGRKGKADKQPANTETNATPEAQPAAESVASQPDEAGTEN